MEVEWTEASLDDMTALDVGIARRVKKTVERFAASGAGDVKKLQDIDPPEYRLRVGDYRVRFWTKKLCASFASETAAKPTGRARRRRWTGVNAA